MPQTEHINQRCPNFRGVQLSPAAPPDHLSPPTSQRMRGALDIAEFSKQAQLYPPLGALRAVRLKIHSSPESREAILVAPALQQPKLFPEACVKLFRHLAVQV